MAPKTLIRQNPHLRNAQDYRRALRDNVLSSTGIEGVKKAAERALSSAPEQKIRIEPVVDTERRKPLAIALEKAAAVNPYADIDPRRMGILTKELQHATRAGLIAMLFDRNILIYSTNPEHARLCPWLVEAPRLYYSEKTPGSAGVTVAV
jgi:hypothetical protein